MVDHDQYSFLYTPFKLKSDADKIGGVELISALLFADH